MNKTNATEHSATEARMALQSAVHISNTNDEHPITLIWSPDGQGGFLDYRDCLVMFAFSEPQGPVPAIIRIYEVLGEAELPTSTVDLYNGLQTICLFGVVPMISPHADRDRIVLDGVCACLVADNIAGPVIIDAIFRVAMAADAFRQEKHHNFWEEYRGLQVDARD